MGTTALQGFEIPDLSDAANAPAFMATFGEDIEKQTVMRYATEAARDASVTSPEERMLAATADKDRLWMHTGSGWQFIGWYSTAGRPGVILTDAAQSIANATSVDITWGTEVSDVDGWTSGASATLTVPTGWGGRYAISYSGRWSAASGTLAGVAILINGVALYETPAAGPFLAPGVNAVISLAATDTIKVQAYQNTGGAINITSRLEVVWLGP